MTPEFEIKYIEVTWYDRDTVTRITESIVSLSPEYNQESNAFECETTIYPNTEGLRGQLAVRFLVGESQVPYIDLPGADVQYLSPVKDLDTGVTWWIFKDSWDARNGYWTHAGINTAGTLKFVFNNQSCHVLIGSIDFSRSQLETYLSTFKHDLWELILDESSSIQADREDNSTGITEEVIHHIERLVHHVGQILITPKSELREIQTLKPRKYVKPVNRTFMELATRGGQRYLTSRATSPSYNVAENRYILFAIERCYRIIKQITILSENKSRRYSDTARKLKNQIDSLADTVDIDKDLVKKDLSILQEKCRLDYWQQLLLEKIRTEGLSLTNNLHLADWYIQTERYSYNSDKTERDGFFIQVNVGGFYGKDRDKATILSCRYHHRELLNCLLPYSEYRISAQWERTEYQRVVKYTLSSISQIEVLSTSGMQRAREKFRAEREIGIQLNANGWKRNLTPKELSEQKRERQALSNRYNYYVDVQKSADHVFKKVEPKLRQLLKIIKGLKRLKITPSSHFPNSMTFVQNPSYQGVHSGYRALRDATNLADDDLLIALERIESIGLVNMPLLYERWCLLQIVKVLRESFRYTPQNDWKYKLIAAISSNSKDIEIELDNRSARRFIRLTYEKKLDNGRVPDFVLDVDWYGSLDHSNQNRHHTRFVLDAKFYNKKTFERFGGLFGVISELRDTKGYRESTNNPVFIIHPCHEAMPDRVTAQDWGKHSFLGELAIGENLESPDHQFGAIFLNPVDRNFYSDELQRLLGLLLQYKIEDADTAASDNDMTVSQPFCIRCGSTDLSRIESRSPRSVWMECKECFQFVSYNHCGNTGTRIIKNGFYWTYHSARAIEPFNNKCPKCGEWGAW